MSSNPVLISPDVAASQSCPVCDNGRDNRIHQAREMMFGSRDRFDYLECGNCGTLSLCHPPDDPGKYYPCDYYSFQRAEGLYRFVKEQLAQYSYGRQNPIGRLAALFLGPEGSLAAFRSIQPAPASRILDVGSGSGAFLEFLARAGFERLLGIDPYLSQPGIDGKGYTLRKANLVELTETFDVITLNHVFEHLMDPLSTLQQIRRLLATDGVAILRFPVADSYAWRHFGVDWVQLDCPRHMFLHTRKGMALLAGKAGLEIRKELCDSTSFQFWGSRLYRRDIPLTSPRSILKSRWRLLLHLPRLALDNSRARHLNRLAQGDSACFHLTRPGARASWAEKPPR